MARRFAFHAAPLALVGALLAQPAQAAPAGIMAIPLAVTSAFSAGEMCPASPAPKLTLAVAPAPPAQTGTSKTSALLGGRVSQLDLMRQQQGLQTSPPAPQVTGYAAIGALQPGAGPLTLAAGASCAAGPGFALQTPRRAPQLAAAVLNPLPPAPGDFLASKRLAIGHTRFDSAWNHVRGSGLSRRAVNAVLPRSRGPASAATLGAVNGWANASIRYVEDRQLYGEADHWATASETLRRHEGDCEDIAIVKMQLLAARGIRREDMSLVIARDLVRGADHAVLVVRMDGRMWLLDNATDQVLDAAQSYDYRPILSFSENRKWIHGY